jgi:hypothetical protein
VDTLPPAGVPAASSRFLRYMLFTAQNHYYFNELSYSVGTRNWRRVSIGESLYNVNVMIYAKFQLSTTCVAYVTAL